MAVARTAQPRGTGMAPAAGVVRNTGIIGCSVDMYVLSWQAVIMYDLLRFLFDSKSCWLISNQFRLAPTRHTTVLGGPIKHRSVLY